MRDEIKEYLNSEEGSLPWQQNYIKRTYRNNNTSGVQPEGEGGGWRRGGGGVGGGGGVRTPAPNNFMP